MGKINSKKVVIDGIEFDSTTEAEYFQYLMSNKDELEIEEIKLQPFFVLIPEFKVDCKQCVGEGRKPSPKTGNLIKCKRCDGEGEVSKQSWTYKPDFEVMYKNGYIEFIDVKGFANERFPLVKKMFEYRYGTELIVVKKTNKGWVRK